MFSSSSSLSLYMIMIMMMMMKTYSFSPKYPQVTQLAARYWRHSWCSTAGHPSYILLPW
jgi:hypothetical protein